MSGIVMATISSGSQVLPVSQGTGTVGLSLSGMGVVSVSSGLMLSGGALLSDLISSSGSIDTRCPRCNRAFYQYVQGADIVVRGVSGLYERWCWQCAGYRYTERKFETREDWIRDTVPDYLQQAPSQIIADYLQDQSRYKDSEYMRNLKSMSGG